MKRKSANLFFIIIVFLSLSACTKTADLPPLSNSKIVAYKVPVADGTILGAIDESDKTITVYLPFYYQLDVIDPEITVADGARLQEEVKPVAVLDSSITYTVKGADQSTATYKLIIVLQQIAPLVIQELSSETTITAWGVGASNIVLRGNFNTNDPAKISAYLVNEAGQETALSANTGIGPANVTVSIIGNEKLYTFGNLQIPQTLDTGLYKVKVKVQALSAESQYPVRLTYQQPVIDHHTITVRGGDNFTIKTTSNVFHDFREFSIIVNGEKVLLPIESYTRTEAVIRVPNSVPPGQYYPTAFFGTFSPFSTNWPITVVSE
ncbi:MULTISPECIES: hypothetical protein [Olivibacter]|jgi:hypothetical protein|uniref:DUF5018 domain-containing protein n=2 Tax=Sphingobacteriaceae TaxID=84566 RepID=F4C2G6_SPHS2|nr:MULTISPECIES: hypothetical protein [Olivibacter]MDX3914049.1 hypothetical protein [Pseudosphingobacterium sp.]QEL02194.1 hypothetical protein FKG96_15720 [Olivibacter sp. LS-1]